MLELSEFVLCGEDVVCFFVGVVEVCIEGIFGFGKGEFIDVCMSEGEFY